MGRLLIALAAALIAGCATAAVQADLPPAIGLPADATPELARELAGRSAGKPEICLEQTRVLSPDIIDAKHILYRQSRQRVWLAEVRGNCGTLSPDDILRVELFGLQLCENDRFQVLLRNSGIPTAYCFFGKFTPYDLPKRPKS